MCLREREGSKESEWAHRVAHHVVSVSLELGLEHSRFGSAETGSCQLYPISLSCPAWAAVQGIGCYLVVNRCSPWY